MQSPITGLTAGSTLTATSDDGTTINIDRTNAILSAAFTTQGTKNLTLVETLAGATGSPKTTPIAITITAAVPWTADKTTGIVGMYDTNLLVADTTTATEVGSVANAITGLPSLQGYGNSNRSGGYGAPDIGTVNSKQVAKFSAVNQNLEITIGSDWGSYSFGATLLCSIASTSADSDARIMSCGDYRTSDDTATTNGLSLKRVGATTAIGLYYNGSLQVSYDPGSYNVLMVVSVVVAAGNISMWVNGALVNTVTTAANPTFNFQKIDFGKPVNGNVNHLIGTLGTVYIVKGANNATTYATADRQRNEALIQTEFATATLSTQNPYYNTAPTV